MLIKISGTLTTDKFTYRGYWSHGQKDGYGNLERKNGFKYVGEWKADQKNGYGSVYWPDGAKYGKSLSVNFSSGWKWTNNAL